jgi:HEPN domain-containing protein
MDLLITLAAAVDRLDPAIGAFLDHFRDGHVPLHLSFAIVAAALALLALLIVWGAAALGRIHRLRRLMRGIGSPAEFKRQFRRIDAALTASLFGPAWREYRQSLKASDDGVLYARRPDECLGLHAIDSASFPARFFAAMHGYFIGVGLLLTFVGLVAALKFAAAGVASADLAVAKQALNGLLSAASFKFMTSIAGLGCSLMLSIAARTVTYFIEGAALGLAHDLERVMVPIVAECVAYDQLAATRAQLVALERIASAPAANAGAASDHESLQHILKAFLTEMRGSAGTEMKQLAGKLSDIGDAMGQMQTHIGNSGQGFADQMSLAASRLLRAATTLEASLDGRVQKMGAKIDSLAGSFAKSEATFATVANKAAQDMAQRLGGVLGGFGDFTTSLQSQIASMREIASSLDSARRVLDDSAGTWMRSAAPVAASVEASRQIAAELGQVASRVGTAQRDMAEMARAMVQLSEKTSSVWDNYQSRFEKVDDDLQLVFDRLQGGTRAFGKEFMDFVGKLDSSFAEGMQALALGTEELREVAEILAIGVTAKAA